MGRLVLIAGTRPEFIKAGPVIRALRNRGRDVFVLSTGQHTDLLAQTHLPIDQTLDIPHDPDPIIYGEAVSRRCLLWLSENATVDRKVQGVMVVGDTASSWGGAKAAYDDSGSPVIHIEAGVRSHDLANPYPEEGFRVEIDRMADWHFCPTGLNALNLQNELTYKTVLPGYPHVWHVTGNPGIDALYENTTPQPVEKREKIVLVTLHRRESWGAPMLEIVKGIDAVAKQRKDLQFLVPCHPNGQVELACAKLKYLTLTEPMPPEGFQHTLARCQAVVTDSGGVQEEASALGVPCVVAREVTDRPESVESGHAILGGRTAEGINTCLQWAIGNPFPEGPFPRPARDAFLGFGDGHASERIADLITQHFGA